MHYVAKNCHFMPLCHIMPCTIHYMTKMALNGKIPARGKKVAKCEEGLNSKRALSGEDIKSKKLYLF